MQLIDRPNGTFTTQEIARLTAYRAAVAAGFYTDWDDSAETTDIQVVEELDPPATEDESEPFITEVETQEPPGR